MNVCDNLGDHLVGNIYIKVRYLKEEIPVSQNMVTMILSNLHQF